MSTLPLFDDDGRDDRDDDRRDASGGGKGRGRPEERVYRVAQINRAVRSTLEDRWPTVWIEGELSDVTRAASGHVYFTLNDEEDPAQLRGVMFRGDAQRSRTRLDNGARVRMRGQLTLFEPRGTFQLIARVVIAQGLGDLHAQFEAVRRKLLAEGLLDTERKRALPQLPRTIGVVTSEHGAAVHDIVRVASERMPLRIVLAPCLVQGQEAPASILAALETIQRLDDLEVVIVGRGGGSAEDLWVFNDERVARAIAACRVPTVSAVGHETDVTIADLVADVRAATPSNAAEIVVPDRRALLAEVASLQRGLERAFEAQLGRLRLRLERAERRLASRGASLGPVRRRIDVLLTALIGNTRERLAASRRHFDRLREQLGAHDPRIVWSHHRRRLTEQRGRIERHAQALVERRRARLGTLVARLQALSPLAVLGRGYAVALHEGTGRALLRASDAAVGDAVLLRLHDGRLRVRVEGSES